MNFLEACKLIIENKGGYIRLPDWNFDVEEKDIFDEIIFIERPHCIDSHLNLYYLFPRDDKGNALWEFNIINDENITYVSSMVDFIRDDWQYLGEETI